MLASCLGIKSNRIIEVTHLNDLMRTVNFLLLIMERVLAWSRVSEFGKHRDYFTALVEVGERKLEAG